MIDLNADMTLRIAYISKVIQKISAKIRTLMRTTSSLVMIDESVGKASYMIVSMDSKHSHPGGEFNEHRCTGAYRRVIPPRSNDYLHVRSNTHGVQLVISYENIVTNCQAFVVQGIIEIALTQPFILKATT